MRARVAPAQPADRHAHTLVADRTRPDFSGRVLLVEDNAINQRVAQRFLERLGCEVHVVGDGARACAAHAAGTYDLILMDMQMPVMDGIEATQRIREREAPVRAHRSSR